MHLAAFLIDLFDEGKVTVAGELIEFDEDDLNESKRLLEELYNEDILTMPLIAPAFSPTAAVWAAKYIYRVIQFTMLRHLEQPEIEKHLINFEGEVNAETIYSVDLTFRHLPQLFRLSEDFAPGDFLTERLRHITHLWPFSSVGIELTQEFDESGIMDHRSLEIAYIDRIIEKNDLKRVNNKQKEELVGQALGDYASKLWPAFVKN
jgi:hypothetical protein